MKQFLAIVLLAVLSTVVHAQVTCQTNGNTTNCNGSLGPAIAPVPFINFGAQQAQQAQAQANANLQNQQAALAQQQAQLARAQTDAIRQQTQTDAIRQQTVAANQQRFMATVAAASDDQLRTLAERWNSVDCQNSSACRADAAFTVPAINAEMQLRQQEAQAWNPASLRAEYESCVNVQGAGGAQCRELKQMLDRTAAAQVPQTREQFAEKGTAAPTDKLKADAATFEAIMRSAPPDSKAFRDAVKSLQATNQDLAERGALK